MDEGRSWLVTGASSGFGRGLGRDTAFDGA
jgi:hypothetical protein